MQRRKDQTYCSRACRWKAKNRGEVRYRLCRWCGAQFVRNNHDQWTCSHRCALASKRYAAGEFLASRVGWRTCRLCSVVYTSGAGRTCACDLGYVHVFGDLTTFTCGCGTTWAGSRRQGRVACEDCKVEAKRRAGRARRAAKLAVDTEPYRTVDIYERDGWVCQLCGRKVNRQLRWPHARSVSIDHIIPLSKGGPDVPANVQCAHLGCNASKRDRPANEQLRLVG